MAIIEIHDNYSNLGINTRPITNGEEFDMVNGFIAYKKETFKEKPEKKLAIFLETKINNAYPDIVFTEYNPFSYEKWNKARSALNLFDMKILHYIYTTRNVTSQKIIKNLSIQYKELLTSLEKLIDAILVTRKNGYWVLHNRDIFGVKKVEAIEAKISKWDKVMQQALINRTFASESFILSKKMKTLNPEIIMKMDEFGIGVYIYNNIEFSKIIPAKKRKFPMNYNSIYFNECIGRILNNN